MGDIVGSDLNKEILKALRDLGREATSKEIAEKIGVQTSKVSCRLAPLRKKGLLDSPEKGKWVITEKGIQEVQ